MEKTKNILLTISVILITLITALNFYQHKLIQEQKELLELVDTTTTMTVDTLFLEKTITDTVPQYITQTIFKTDTLYKKEGDSISATPLLITLKKKKLVE